MYRPYFNTTIAALEREFVDRAGDAAFLEVLEEELTHHSTDRARVLAAKVEASLTTLAPPNPQKHVVRQDTSTPAPVAPPVADEPVSVLLKRPTPDITDRPADVLAAWTALEVLSPPSFRRAENLAGGDVGSVAMLEKGLPWILGGKAKPGTRVYYQIVLGSIDLGAAVKRLVSVYADDRAERPALSGEAILAVLLLDKDGRPIEENPAMVSSFGWGVPKALAGEMASLGGWSAVEAKLNDQLAERISVRDEEGKLHPLDRQAIDDAYVWLVESLKLPSTLIKPPRFAIRRYVAFRSNDPPEPLLLNSFFLADLARARDLFARDQAPQLLQRYLGVLKPDTRPDLFTDTAAVADAVAPARFSPARWPGRGRHPLVLLQQAAINLALAEGRAGGVLAVNGPPGTGKTTLLRDLLAALVTERARAMLEFRDPAQAFRTTGKTLKAGAGWLHLYSLDPRLKGYEMLVASSNNKAVENVSAELPGLSAVAEDAEDLRYFQTLADELLGGPSWGLGAAVLGNGGNRHRFRQTFWWDKEVGLATYLAAAAGKPQTIDADDRGPERPPRIVAAENPPRDHAEALRRWATARDAFSKALTKSEAALAELEQLRIASFRLPELCEAFEALAELSLRRPGFWSRLFFTRVFRSWNAAAVAAEGRAVSALDAASQVLQPALAAGLRRLFNQAPASPTTLEGLRTQLAAVRAHADAGRLALNERFVDAAFFDREHGDRHKASPWLDPVVQRGRDDVFIKAMALHKAFIDAAAAPLRHNLGALMNVLGGGGLGDPEKDALIPELWSSLFLVVPALSTTFASVDRMLGAIPPESLGWLLVDEAGQALPQAAIGALLRSKRAVVVGDPVQIPPVVVLPDTLTSAIHRSFGVDPDRFAPPSASVQTLSDAATPYMAEFIGTSGSRTVGVPLLVHRRCAEPMFSISNQVAYERMMVHGKAATTSPIAKILGPSRWIDVQGGASDKWSPEEGEVVLGLLAQLIQGKVELDLYIVTPFVVVADGLRRLIVESGVLAELNLGPAAWTRERVGTVHTVQGREAEAVIFVLGAPLPQQQGARAWAGGQPNLLNVAVTRSKEVLYVVGAHEHWSKAGVFSVLSAHLRQTSP